MGEIYGKATRTVVWLGESLFLKDTDSLDDEEYFHRLGSILDRLPDVSVVDSGLSTTDSETSSVSSESYDGLYSVPPPDSPAHSDAAAASDNYEWPESNEEESSEEESDSSSGNSELRVQVLDDEKALIGLLEFPEDIRGLRNLDACSSALPMLLEPLLRHGYWHRVWIIQELALSSEGTLILVGRSQLYFSRLLRIAGQLLFGLARFYGPSSSKWLVDDSVNARGLLHQIKRFRHNVLRGVPSSGWMWRGILSRSTLPVDKYYGIFGLMNKSFIADAIVDYSRSPTEVSIDATRLLWKEQDCFYNFGFTRLKDDHDLPRIPSWPVDLTQNYTVEHWLPLAGAVTDPMTFDTEEFLGRQPIGNSRLLLIKGTRLDLIDGITAYVPEHDASTPNSTSPVSKQISHALSNTKGKSNSYDSYIDLLKDLCVNIFPELESSPTFLFSLPILALNSHQVSQGLNIHQIEFLRDFLQANIDFRLWDFKLTSFFPGFGHHYSTSDVPSPTTLSDTPTFRTAKNFGHHSKLYIFKNAFLAQI
jgi:hypothetical protein